MSKDKFTISTLFEVELFTTEKGKHHYLEKEDKIEKEHNESSHEIYYSLWLIYFHTSIVIL